jgi:hypothetical protein
VAVGVAVGVAVAAAVAAAAGCSPARDAYFRQPNPTRITGSAAVGARALVGVADLVAAADDRVVLVRAAPVGFGGTARIDAWALRRADADGGGIGFSTADALRPGLLFSTLARPLGSFAFTAADGPIQVVLAVESDRSGTVAFDSVEITFRVDGEQRTQVFPASASISFDGPGC